MTAQHDDAETLIAEAEALGCVPALQGDWVIWQPPLPVELILRAMPLANEIARILQTAQEET